LSFGSATVHFSSSSFSLQLLFEGLDVDSGGFANIDQLGRRDFEHGQDEVVDSDKLVSLLFLLFL
jgi:hypothetical protein